MRNSEGSIPPFSRHTVNGVINLKHYTAIPNPRNPLHEQWEGCFDPVQRSGAYHMQAPMGGDDLVPNVTQGLPRHLNKITEQAKTEMTHKRSPAKS